MDIHDNIPVSMIRDTLDDVLQFDLPQGYRLRTYQAGDEQFWREIHIAADKYNEYPESRFPEQFGTDEKLLTERQFYLCTNDGTAIATASAWFTEQQGLSYGMLHWVALVPDYHGQGLSKPLLTAVFNRMRELGHERAYLDTQSMRIPAISLYLKFGFQPNIQSAEDEAIWTLIRAHLK